MGVVAKAFAVAIHIEQAAERHVVLSRRFEAWGKVTPVKADKAVDDHALVERGLVLLVGVVGKVQQAEHDVRKLGTISQPAPALPTLPGNGAPLSACLEHQG